MPVGWLDAVIPVLTSEMDIVSKNGGALPTRLPVASTKRMFPLGPVVMPRCALELVGVANSVRVPPVVMLAMFDPFVSVNQTLLSGPEVIDNGLLLFDAVY